MGRLLRRALEVDVIVGVVFGAPQRAPDQRRKIIAIAAQATGWHSYRIDATGMNTRLLANDPPGWTAKQLVDELVARPARVLGFDLPFCVPHALLRGEKFAKYVGYKDGAFFGWRSFNWWIAQRLPITDFLDFTPFAPWRDRAERARHWTKRAKDIAAGGQPPHNKDKFRATFQMALLGNALLPKLWELHRYRVLPFPSGRGAGEIIEVYPGATLRAMGLASYKSRPDEAVRHGIAACAAAGIKLEVDLLRVALVCRYSPGTRKSPDYDVADAFVGLCTASLHAESGRRPVLAPDPTWQERLVKEWEGATWVPAITTSAPEWALPSIPMNKRLRKKKRVGEFKELGFELLCDLRPGISNDDFDAFVDRLIVAVEARKLAFGGGGGRDGKFQGFVTRMALGSATEDDRTALAAFLAGEGAIVGDEVGVLDDGNHDLPADV